MGEPALDKANNPLSIEGFEEVFDTSEATPSTSEDLDTTIAHGSEVVDETEDTTSEVFGTAREILTTTEAATRLGISTRAVINRLKAGTLAGQRTKGRFKEEWRVYWEDLPNSSEDPAATSRATSEHSEPEPTDRDEKFRTSSEHASGEHILSELLSAHTEQIKAQNELIRYLTEQLKDKDDRIKLLTDSKGKQRWWSRFACWFIGRS
jgi:hypothetical protein